MSSSDFALTADPASPDGERRVRSFAENGPKGEPDAAAIAPRSARAGQDRICIFCLSARYETLNLKPDPTTTARDQQALGLGCGRSFHRNRFSEYQALQRIRSLTARRVGGPRYRPRSSADRRRHGRGIPASTSKTRIDADKKIWYGEMRIPMDRDRRPPAGARTPDAREFLPDPRRPSQSQYIAWQPTPTRTMCPKRSAG